MRNARFAGALAALALFAAPAVWAQARWENQGLATEPPNFPRVLAWNPDTETIWWSGRGASFTEEIWEYDGISWSQRPAAGTPPSGAVAGAFDVARRRLVVSSGDQTWEYDGVQWEEIIAPAVPTPSRGGFSMTYDPTRQQVVLFGGDPGIYVPYYPYGSYLYLSDLWGWDGTTWTMLSDSSIPGREWSSIVADPERGTLIVSGGWYSVPYMFTYQQTVFELNDTYEWDGTSWRRVNGTRGRRGHHMVYDSFRKRVVMFGGSGACGYACGFFFDSTAELVDDQWVATQIGGPVPRNDPRMAFDEKRRRIVMTGGFASGTPGTQETWEYYTTAPALFSTFGRGCEGSAGTPTLALENGQWPWLGDTFELRADNLPASAPLAMLLGTSDTTFAGATLPLPLPRVANCSLRVSPDVVLGVANQGGTATWQLDIPDDPALRGGILFEQLVVVDPPSSALGLTLTPGGRAKIGAR
ncbi:MAG: hypothetical protein AAF628_22605 [Planctomycetota bacterium]